jgi:hypothetical protein
MSKQELKATLSTDPPKTMELCRRIIAEMGWKIEAQSENRLVCKELVDMWMKGVWPVKLELTVQTDAAGSLLLVKGTNSGIGPIQSNHVKGQVGNFINRLTLAIQAPAASPPPSHPGLSAELEKLSELREQGVLTDDEFAAAKSRILTSNP